MEVMSFYSEDLRILTDLIEAVHRSSNLEEVYRVVLDSIVELENVDMAAIYLVDEQKQEAVLEAYRNFPEDYVKRASRIPRPRGLTWKVINTGRMLSVENVQRDPDIGPAGRDLGHLGVLGIPIFLEERVIGVIWFASHKEREFNQKEINLLSSFGDQIAIAISRAKQTDKLEERNKDLSILSAISQAIHQSIDLDQIYKTVLDVTKDLKFINLISVYLVEGEGDKREAVLQVHRGYTEEYLKRASIIPYGRGVTWRVITSGEPVYYEDASHPSTEVGSAGKALGQRALLCIPVKSGNQTIGTVGFSSLEKVSFIQQELDFLLSLGNQIGTAIAKARMFEEMKEQEGILRVSLNRLYKKNQYETIIGAVTQSVHQSINLQEVLDNAISSMCQNMDKVESVAIYLVEGEEAILNAHIGHPDWFIKRAGRIPYPKGFTWRTIIEGEIRYCADTDEDNAIGPAGREVGIKSYVSIPIRFENKTIGCININSFQKNAFDQEDLNLLEIVAKQMEIALSNARQAEALRQSEERYRDLVENSLDLICTHDLEGNILSVNRALVKQSGYESAEDFVGRKISDFLSPDVRHLFSSYIDTIVREGEARGLMKVLTRSGEERILEYHNSLRTEGVDKPIVRGMSHDVTERKRTEEALQQSLAQLSKKNRYEAIISTVTRSVHRSIDLEEVLENAVESLNQNIGGADIVVIRLIEGEEAVIKAQRGLPEWIIERVRRIPYPTGITWKTIIEGKPRYCPDIGDVDQDRFIGPAGREIGIKGYVSMPIDLEGRTIGTLNITSLEKNAFSEEDLNLLEIVVRQIEVAINNARQAEALRESREKFRSLVEQTSDFVWEIDENGAFTYVNPKAYEILGYEPGEILGKTTFDFMLPDEAKRFAEVIGSFISAKRPFKSLEKALIHKDGHTVVLEISGSPIFNAEGVLRGYRGIARDITERKQAEKALRKAYEELEMRVEERTTELMEVNKALQTGIAERKRAEEQIKASLEEKEVLLREIHHRVKNNLQIISGLLNLQAGYIKDKQVLKMLSESQTRIKSMALVHEQLYKSKDLARIDFPKYIRDLADNLLHSYRANSSAIKLNINVDRVSLGVDTAIPCGLIINELISNSLKHAFPEGREVVRDAKLLCEAQGDGSNEQELPVGLTQEQRKRPVAHLFATVDSRAERYINSAHRADEVVRDATCGSNCCDEQEQQDAPANRQGHPGAPIRRSCDRVDEEGEINISLYSHRDKGSAAGQPNFTLIVGDNGVGFPENLDFRNTESLGLQLVVILVEQIGGSIDLSRNSGTEFKITFKELKKKRE